MKRAAGALLAVVLALSGCTSSPTPSPSPSSTPALPTATDAIAAGTLRFAIATEPSGFLPPALDPGTARIQHFIYDALYRLDARLAAVPDLAAGPPSVSPDGLTWTIPLRAGVTFSNGSGFGAADVLTTYQLALSPACPFGDLCPIAQDHLQSVTKDRAGDVVLKLGAPFAALQAELLAALPILPSDALAASLGRLLDGASDTDPATLQATVDRISGATSSEDCLAPSPPNGCDPGDYVAELTAIATAAHLPPIDPRRFVDDAGAQDRSAYGSALLAAARSLAQVLSSTKTDQLAAALPLLDLNEAPIGTGAYRFARYEPGAFVELVRRGRVSGGTPGRIRAIVVADPTAATTALLSGDLEWLPEVAPEMAPTLADDPGVRVAARPSGTERALVFNVRPGHPFADPAARLAVLRCVDRPALVAAATNGQGLPATSLVAPASWAFAPGRPPTVDPAATRRALEAAGYQAGADGIYARAGVRLSAQLVVRPGRADLAALAAGLSVDLRDCGIELTVQEVAFSSDVILAALEWPNTFDVFLAALHEGPDPDVDLGWLGSSHVTTAMDPGDANFGGWSDQTTDDLLAQGLGSMNQLSRATTYRELQAHLAAGVPVVPLVLDVAYGAVSTRVRTGDAAVDPGLMTYEQGIDDWTLTGP
ncbi:MAG: ABC transporter substrate-binding protein [Candidatus Limnocylindrales bacterium]